MTYAEFLLMTYPARARDVPNDEFMSTIDLSGKLTEISIATENQDFANLIDAAAVRLLELMETIDKLREELALYIRGMQ